MSLIIDGAAEDFTGLRAVDFLQRPEVGLSVFDRRARITRWIRSIVLHTTVGDEPQVVHDGPGPSGMAERTIAAWASDSRHAGAHLLIDGDGTVFCTADLVRHATYHAQRINEVSIGIEICQSAHLEIWEATQRPALMLLLDVLTRHHLIRIQRQFHAPYRGSSSPVPRLARGGADCVGIFGHRDQTDQRGRGDPGDAVFEWLEGAGYEPMDFAMEHDKAVWQFRQLSVLNRVVPDLGGDGVPGPRTCDALEDAGHPHGLWIARPGDAAP